MKFFLVFAALFAVAYSRRIELNQLVNRIQDYSKRIEKADSSSEEIEDLLKDGLKEVTGQIELAVCKRNSTKLYDAALKSIKCAKESKSEGVICDSLGAEFKKCIEPIEKVFEECLEAKFHDIPKLIIDAVTSTTEYLCNSKVRDIVELSNPCAAIEVDNLKSCITGIESKIKNINAVTNLKTELCGEAVKQKTCLLEQINKNCKNDLTKKSFNDLYEAAIIKPCSA
ncbi:uncharacterized protein LOC123313395 [Coccinella septempunctata]|uniref:uncharacterized protein LOC123313395 n=1 Tax=Coccinella septempunctata TaxID=41139 RepID=UPI001D073CD1|nr:uncharacterized protein LOC123313395 [Coccinella septempunctata]